MTKRLYLAAPFFNPAQVGIIEVVEKICRSVPNLELFSPRDAGVLQDMTPEQRKANLKTIFQGNVSEMEASDGMLAILDDKDTGTTWELGYGYALGQFGRFQVFGFTSMTNIKLNVMLSQCLQAHAVGFNECREMMVAWTTGKDWASDVTQTDAY